MKASVDLATCSSTLFIEDLVKRTTKIAERNFAEMQRNEWKELSFLFCLPLVEKESEDIAL